MKRTPENKEVFNARASYEPVPAYKRSCSHMKLALVQFEGKLMDVTGNTKRAQGLIREAAEEGADMVILPELFSTGYNLTLIGEHLPKLAETKDGPTVKALQDVARECGVYVVAGLALIEELPGVFYNSVVFIDRGGRLVGTTQKLHLWSLERAFFRSGRKQPVYVTEFGTIGVLICYDLGFPEAARSLTLKGADLILCPSAWSINDQDIWDINTSCRALENTVFLAAINRSAREGEVHLGGHTKLCDPRGAVVAELYEEGENILYVDIDLSELDRHRVGCPYLKDRRPEIYDDVVR